MEPATDLTVEGLTSRIVQSSKTISDCIEAEGLQHLSFAVDGPKTFPVPRTFPEVHVARLALIEATDLLRKLVIGPQENTHWICTAVSCSALPILAPHNTLPRGTYSLQSHTSKSSSTTTPAYSALSSVSTSSRPSHSTNLSPIQNSQPISAQTRLAYAVYSAMPRPSVSSTNPPQAMWATPPSPQH